MFGWGKKARDKKEAEIAAQAIEATSLFAVAAFTIVANDAALVEQVLAIAEARASNITGVASTETKTNATEISITLLVDPQSESAKDPE
ncbi:MAG: hypothetical protein AAB680_06460, partial [Pseudomonadota bacterium]